MLIGALILTALAVVAVVVLLRKAQVDPAEFDRKAAEQDRVANGDAGPPAPGDSA